jgi:hypothetical protein
VGEEGGGGDIQTTYGLSTFIWWASLDSAHPAMTTDVLRPNDRFGKEDCVRTSERMIRTIPAQEVGSKEMKTSFRVLAFAVAVLMPLTVFGQTTPTVVTDKTGYVAGETVAISGTGFGPNEPVSVKIGHTGAGATGETIQPL